MRSECRCRILAAVVLAANLSAVWVMVVAGQAQAEDWAPVWSTANLSEGRTYLAATSAAGKVFFGGGLRSGGKSGRVDIYDIATGLWSTASLSEGRDYLAAASAGGKVFFGGGRGQFEYSTTVDIYDTTTGTWSTANLSQSRYGLSATSLGGKVFFVGGRNSSVGYSNRVDVYDTATGGWSTASLSEARFLGAAASADGKVFYAGGYGMDAVTKKVDIYDVGAGAWSTANLSEARSLLAATSAGGKVFIAGGYIAGASNGVTKAVDIYDTGIGAWSSGSLSQARDELAATCVGTKVFFAGGNVSSGPDPVLVDTVDIYDTAKGVWSTAHLSQPQYHLCATSCGNKAFFAGGAGSVVDIYTQQDYGTITTSKAFTLVDQTTVAGRMQLNAPGSLSLDGYSLTAGSMSGDAPINLGAGILTVGSDGTSSAYSGALSGHGSLIKTGAGTLTLGGASSYDGATQVWGGALETTGSIAASTVIVNGGTLRGTGRVGPIMGTKGGLHPGGSPGILASGNLTMSPGFHFDVNLDGPIGGTGYSELDVTGTVNLGGAALGATLGYVPPWFSGGPPDLFYIIMNDGTDAVVGQFEGLPQMRTFELLYNGTAYRAAISYQGDYDAGTLTGGNDVVVIVPEPAALWLMTLAGIGLLRHRKRV